MNAVFPFGFPPATAFYLALYVVTLLVHVIFMNYCLGGCLYLACRLGRRKRDPAAEVLRDWMPFALSAAITAGVAPLLFVQILYKRQFYTANLLLLHRWMSILLVLMAGFYLCYLLKTARLQQRRPRTQLAVAAAACACIVYTGYSWTENHMLSLQPQELWAAHYGAGRMWYFEPQLWPRFGMWFLGAWPTMAALVCWQLRGRGVNAATGVAPLARAALAGLAGAALCSAVYATLLPAPQRAVLASRLAAPYGILALSGAALQIAGWLRLARGQSAQRGPLLAVSLGLVATLAGATVVREALRLAAIDVTALYDQHARAARMGGLAVFLTFALINGLLIAWCIIMARQRTNGEST